MTISGGGCDVDDGLQSACEDMQTEDNTATHFRHEHQLMTPPCSSLNRDEPMQQLRCNVEEVPDVQRLTSDTRVIMEPQQGNTRVSIQI